MDTSVLAMILEFVCNHECYDTFHELCGESNIKECIESDLSLFILFHITKIKYFLHSHSTNPDANHLSNNLDDILQSLCFLIPSHQPSKLHSNLNPSSSSNSNQSVAIPTSPLFDTSYCSTFYDLHQEMKILSVLTCTKPLNDRVSLINNHFKLNPDCFNFRHLDISDDIASNGDIHFDVISIINTLGEIVRKNGRNLEKIESFHQSHSFQSLHHKMLEFLNEIKALYCGAMSNTLYTVSRILDRKSKEEAVKYQGIDRQQWISKMQWYSAPKKVVDVNDATDSIPNGHRIDESKEEPISKAKVVVHPKLTDFTKGMRVRVKQKKKSSDPSSNGKEAEAEYVWTEGIVIKGNKRMITIELGTVHVRVRDPSKIQEIVSVQNPNCNGVSERKHGIKKVNQSKKVQSGNYQRGRRRFEKDEDEALRAGIVKYRYLLNNTKRGEKGIWYHISNDELYAERLRHRTPAMLCDRYRYYVKTNDVP